MTVGPEYPLACISYIATPLVAYVVPSQAATTYVSAGILSSVAQPSSTVSNIASTLPHTPTSSAFTVTSGIAIADPIVVAWQAEDLTLFPTDYANSLVQKGYTAAIQAPGSETATTDSQARNRREGLSTGAKAGLGAGIALTLVALGVVVGFLLIRRQRKHATSSRELVIPEMEDQDQDHAGRKWFYGGKWRSEIQAVHEQNELDSKTVHIVPGPPAELVGCLPHTHTEHREGTPH